MFNFRVTEQAARQHAADMRANAESRRQLKEAPVRAKRRRLAVLGVRRGRDAALAPQWRSC